MKDLDPDIQSINDLATAKEMIRQSARNFQKFFESCPACMSLTTMDRIYVKANKRFCEFFGFSEEEVIGANAAMLGILDPEEHQKVSDLIRLNGRLYNDRVTCITRSGKIVYTISSIEPVFIGGEKFLLSSFLDISKVVDQQAVIEQQNKEILESLNYARLIQTTVLPRLTQVQEVLPDSFVLSIPKHIVSGDFYWVKRAQGRVFIAACDCTGHGVPGALISMVANNLLNKIVGEYRFTDPAEILNQLNREIILAPNDIQGFNFRAGMDMAICVFDPMRMMLEYAGAYNPVYLVRNEALVKLGTDKLPVHLFGSNGQGKFTHKNLLAKTGDCIYMFSDGYPDQFGGPSRKKFLYRRFQQLLVNISSLPMPEQCRILEKTIIEWRTMANEEQTDDILVMGFRL